MNRVLAVVVLALVPSLVSAQANDPGQPKREEQPVPPPAARLTARETRTAAGLSQQHEAMTRRQRVGNAWIPPRASVQRDGSHWIGPAYGDRDLRLDRPWQRGRFTRGIGPRYVWLLEGGSRERFKLGGGWFALAPADYQRAADWRWANEHVVLYPDPAHEGWYRAYNVRLGAYTHVRYLGD